MGCPSCRGRQAAPVVFVVETDAGPEAFDMAITPDAYDLARARAKETGGRVRVDRRDSPT